MAATTPAAPFVAWLALSELMPTRIRSTGMGFALVLNQAVRTGIAAVFLPTVGNFGYSAMFFFWAGCTVISFVTAAFFLPETKGKTLEEIEEYFETAKLRGCLKSPGSYHSPVEKKKLREVSAR